MKPDSEQGWSECELHIITGWAEGEPIFTTIFTILQQMGFTAKVGKVTLKSNGDEAFSDESLKKSDGDEALNDDFPHKVTAMKHLTLSKNL
jgi:hypothetical protein